MLRKFFRIIPFFMLCAVFFTIGTANARKLKGVTFKENITIKGKTCKLNGIGIRKKVIISVYLGALYLERPASIEKEVISSDQVKQVILHFLYKEVKPEQLVDAWNEGFEKNAGEERIALKDKITRFNSFFTESAKKGEKIIITYIPGQGTEVKIKGKIKGAIEGHDFMKALFSIWFGPHPPDKRLKKGMLGK